MENYGKLWSDPSNNFNIEVKANKRPQAYNFIKKETLAQVFSCEFCKNFKRTFFKGSLPVAASVISMLSSIL